MAYNTRQDNYESILPAFELVKRTIWFDWVECQNEYKKYLFQKFNSSYYPAKKISALLLCLYLAHLKVKIERMKNRKELLDELDYYLKIKGIPDEQIDAVFYSISQVIEELGISDIGFEAEPYDIKFSKSFGDVNGKEKDEISTGQSLSDSGDSETETE